jgi:hypothetical protein
VPVRARAALVASLFTLLGAARLVAADDAAPDARCPVALTPAGAPAPWVDAAAELASRLGRIEGPSDCRAVAVDVRPDGHARLTFRTKDGRTAERAIEAPAGLGPAVQALLVTVVLPPAEPKATAPTATTATSAASPPASASASASGAPPRPPAPAPPPPAPRPATRVEAPTTTPPARRLHVAVGASAGARLAGSPVTYVGPAFGLRAGLEWAGFEAALLGEAAPVHGVLGAAAPAGFAFGTYAAGLALGRRDAVAGTELAYSLSIALVELRERADADATHAGGRAEDLGRPRAGAFVRGAWPEGARVRGTLELSADVLIGHRDDNGVAAKDLPGLPRFGGGVAIGAEIGAR